MGRAEAHRGDHKPTPLQVIVDAMNLHAHTCHIMSNAKVFNPAEDFNSMTLVHIFETTLEIYTRLYEANSIKVGDDPLLARERLELGNFAQVAADRLGLELHPEKTRIVSAADGAVFLGFLYKVDERGKVLMFRAPKRVKEIRRRLRRLANKERRGEVGRGATEDNYRCVRARMGKGNSARLIRSMDNFANELKKEIDNAKYETI